MIKPVTYVYLNVLILSSLRFYVRWSTIFRVHHSLFQAVVSYHFNVSLCHCRRRIGSASCYFGQWQVGMVSVTTRTSDGIIRTKKSLAGESSGGKDKDKIRSQVLSRNDQTFFFLMAFSVSGVIKISHHSITDPQPCMDEGIILIWVEKLCTLPGN